MDQNGPPEFLNPLICHGLSGEEPWINELSVSRCVLLHTMHILGSQVLPPPCILLRSHLGTRGRILRTSKRARTSWKLRILFAKPVEFVHWLFQSALRSAKRPNHCKVARACGFYDGSAVSVCPFLGRALFLSLSVHTRSVFYHKKESDCSKHLHCWISKFVKTHQFDNKKQM